MLIKRIAPECMLIFQPIVRGYVDVIEFSGARIGLSAANRFPEFVQFALNLFRLF